MHRVLVRWLLVAGRVARLRAREIKEKVGINICCSLGLMREEKAHTLK
jgi:biotin synthase-like enzyme